MRDIIIDINFPRSVEVVVILLATRQWARVLWYAITSGLWIALLLKNSQGYTPVFMRRLRLWIAGNVARLIMKGERLFAVIRAMRCRLLTRPNGAICRPIPISGICGKAERLRETEQLKALAPEGQVLIACQGYQLCQRDFRSSDLPGVPIFPLHHPPGAVHWPVRLLGIRRMLLGD